MENSDIMLFFFIIWDSIVTIVFIVILLKIIKDKKEIVNYIEELNSELAKIRKK